MPAQQQQTQRGRAPILSSGARSLKIVTPPPAAFTTPYAAEISRVEDELSELQGAHETTKPWDRSVNETVHASRHPQEEVAQISPVSRPSSPPLLPPLSPVSSLESPTGRERSLSPVPSLSWSQGPSIPGTSSEFGDDEDGPERDVEGGKVERGSSVECWKVLEPELQQQERRARAQTARSSCSVRIVGGEVAGVRLSGDGDASEAASIHESDDKKVVEDWPLPSGPHQQYSTPVQTPEKEHHILNDKALPRLPPRAATADSSPELQGALATPAKLRKARPLSVLPRSSTDPALADPRPEQLKRHSFHVASALTASYDDWGLPVKTDTATGQPAPSSRGSKSPSPTRKSATLAQQRQSKTKFPSLNNIFSVAGGSSAPMSLGLVSTTLKTSPTKESLPESSPFGDGNRTGGTAFTGDQKRSSIAQISPRASDATLAQLPPASIAQAKGSQVAESVRSSTISHAQSHSAIEQRPTHHRRASSKLQAAASFFFGFGGGSGNTTTSPTRSPVASPSSPTRSGATSPLRTVQHQSGASFVTSISAGDGDRFQVMEYEESDLEDDDAQDEDDEILSMDITRELATSSDSSIEEMRSHAENLLRRMQSLHATKLQDQQRQRQRLRARHRGLRTSRKREVDRVWHTLDAERQQMQAQQQALEEQRRHEIQGLRNQHQHDTQDLREELDDAREREHHLKRQLDGIAGRTEALEKEVRTREAEIERLKWCLGEVRGELTDRRVLESGQRDEDDGMRSVIPCEADGEESIQELKRLHRESRTPFMRSEAALGEENIDLKRRIRELEEILSGCLGLMD
ncbi:MAG: hypothetical protein M1831_002908 [Alyxoria varia]|nr:MAG: hypothetical protein M1831_002908 [Alyxoria varia]